MPGAPRKVDHRTGSSAAFAGAVAERLPHVGVSSARGATTYAADGHKFLTVYWADGSGTAHLPDEDVDLELGRVGRDEVRMHIEDAWAAVAPKRAVSSYRAARRRRAQRPAPKQDDIRKMVLSLPGATEGPIWGKELGFLIGTDKKTRFARFGPPAGGRVGNLLPPDDVDTVVLFYCPQKPELLASSPDRFFTTPHYGSPDEPGGIIVRLTEHRGTAELAELEELIEDAWREVASPELIADLERDRT
jgi:hypothetical protein